MLSSRRIARMTANYLRYRMIIKQSLKPWNTILIITVSEISFRCRSFKIKNT